MAKTLTSRTDPAADWSGPRVADFFAAAAARAFAGMVRSCWITGSVAYGGAVAGTSDLDVMVVLDDSAYGLSREELLARLGRFVVDYLALHRATGFVPDLVFPGEYVTAAQLRDACDARGLGWRGPCLELGAVSPEYWDDPEHWFRAWLAQTAFSRWPHGDLRFHARRKGRAWEAIIKATLLAAHPDQPIRVSAERLTDDLRLFGVRSTYADFSVAEATPRRLALRRLARERCLRVDEYGVEPQWDRLLKWASRTHARQSPGVTGSSTLLLDRATTVELGQLASEEWRKLGGEPSYVPAGNAPFRTTTPGRHQ